MKNRSKELQIGLFTLLTLVVFFMGLSFLKGNDIFSNDNVYFIRFQDIIQLSESSNVFVNGYKAGIVRSIKYENDNKGTVIVKIKADKELKFPVDSWGEIDKSLIGELSIHILLGKNDTKYLNPGDTINGIIRGDLMETLDNMLKTEILNLILKLDNTLSDIDLILGNKALTSAIENADNLLLNLSHYSKSLTELISNHITDIAIKADSIGDNLISLSNKLEKIEYDRIAIKTDSLLGQLIQVAENLQITDNSAGLLLNDDLLYNELKKTIVSINTLMDDIKENPKKYVKFSIF